MTQLLTNKRDLLFSLFFLLSAHFYIFGQEREEAVESSSTYYKNSAPAAPTGFSPEKTNIRAFMAEAQSNIPLEKGIFEPLPETDFFDHVRFGGSLGASFSNGNFSGYLAPKAVYDFNPYFSAGLGTMGSYTNGSNYTAWTFGGSVIGLTRPFPALQLSAELEENYVSRNFEFDGNNLNDNFWTPALFLGIGYINGNVTVGIRYDLLHDDQKSIYANAFMPFVTILF